MWLRRLSYKASVLGRDLWNYCCEMVKQSGRLWRNYSKWCHREDFDFMDFQDYDVDFDDMDLDSSYFPNFINSM